MAQGLANRVIVARDRVQRMEHVSREGVVSETEPSIMAVLLRDAATPPVDGLGVK